MDKPIVRRPDLLYPELSYKILGALFDVANELGYQYKEIHYQRAVAQRFNDLGISFESQPSVPILFQSKIIGRYFFDFLIDGKIILELKRGDNFSKKDIEQVIGYLKSKNIKLGILARFSPKGLITKRIINEY